MVKMIPQYYKENFVSNAERKVFKALEKIDIDCTIFHSLSLGSHVEKVYGEIDFVIIYEEGILCLEIKGGAVYRENGIWYFEDRFGNVNSSKEGPFKQAIGNMYSLQGYLKKNLGRNHPLVKCQYACGVVFPDFTFNRKGPDFIPEIVYDNRYSDEELTVYIKKVFNYWRKATKEKHNFEGNRLTGVDIKKAENILRGDFACIPSLGNMSDEIDKKLIELTEEQYNNFKMISENERVILKGGAGTGKTLLALEHAKRMADLGKNVLYLCYNKLIASYLKYKLSIEDYIYESNIEITNFHEYIGRYINTDDLSENNSRFFQKVMPERFIQFMEVKTFEETFDAIIIDEGQDLLRIAYIMCIDEILKGGINNGRWFVFYDDNQNIYNEEFEEGYLLLKSYRPTILSLNLNCRNTIQIGTYNMLLTGLKHEEIMKVQGENVECKSYKTNSELKRQLIKLIKILRSQEVNIGDVTILSPYSFQNSGLEGQNIFHSICSFQNISNTRFQNVQKDSLKFCTIQSFKGMESKVLILIDMNKFTETRARFLNYTGISRARVLLYIFYNSESEQEINTVIKESLEKFVVKS